MNRREFIEGSGAVWASSACFSRTLLVQGMGHGSITVEQNGREAALRASSAASLTGETLGGGSVGSDGQWHGDFGRVPRETVLETPAASAMLVEFEGGGR